MNGQARTKTNILGERFGSMPKETAEFFDFIMPKMIEKTHERILNDFFVKYDYLRGEKRMKIRSAEKNGNEKERICEGNETV